MDQNEGDLNGYKPYLSEGGSASTGGREAGAYSGEQEEKGREVCEMSKKNKELADVCEYVCHTNSEKISKPIDRL